MGFFDRLKARPGTRRRSRSSNGSTSSVEQADAPAAQRTRPDRRRDARGARRAPDHGRRRRRRDRRDRRGGAQARRGAARACATLVKQEILRIFDDVQRARAATAASPHVMLIVGVNGTGKTTTVGKLANLLRSAGKQPLICAADTFRAAAVDQLQIWADRAGVDMVRAQRGLRSGRGGVRRDGRRQGARTRYGAGRHRRPPAHAHQPDERARQDSPHRRARSRRRAARSAARARRDRRPERPRAGARVHQRRRRQRHRADQARRHRQGRRRRGDRPRSEAADPLRRRRRRRSTICCRSRRANTSTRCSRRSGDQRRRRYMQRALFHAARGRGAHHAESDGRRGRRFAPTAWSSGRAVTSAPGSRTPKCTRWTRPASARAARRCT